MARRHSLMALVAGAAVITAGLVVTAPAEPASFTWSSIHQAVPWAGT